MFSTKFSLSFILYFTFHFCVTDLYASAKPDASAESEEAIFKRAVAEARKTHTVGKEENGQEKCYFEVFWNDIEDLSTEKAQSWLAKEGPHKDFPESRYVPLLLPVYPYSGLDSITFLQTAVTTYETWGESYPKTRAKFPLISLAPSFGFVTLPEGEAPCPGVVICHGSEGPVLENYLPYARLLAQNGIASIMASPDIGHFSISRDAEGSASYVASPVRTADAQLMIPLEQQIVATSRIAEIFATHPRLVGQKLGVLGFSRGGNVALEVCLDRVRGFLKPQVAFSACALYYPFPIQHRREKSAVPIHILHGEEDTYTPLKPVQSYFEQVDADVTWSIFPGVGHGFDGIEGALEIPFAHNLSQCWVQFSQDREFFTGLGTTRVQPKSDYAAHLFSQMTMGASLKGTKEAKEQSHADLIAFFKGKLF